MDRLTETEHAALADGFWGPRPGSNSYPLLELKKGNVKITGERIDALVRAGILVATAADSPHEIKGGDAGPYGEIPDIDLNYKYFLAAAYR